MSSRGQFETQKLKQNLENQLDRLVQQLAELEECKSACGTNILGGKKWINFSNDLDENEYEETKKETMEQLHEFNNSLTKMISGDMTLVDQLGSVQLATQAAISAAFQTPDVIRMFARREPGQLRERLTQVDRDVKLGKRSANEIIKEKLEILRALQHLGDTLTPDELAFLNEHNSRTTTQFTEVSDGVEAGEKALEIAGCEVRAMSQK